MFSDGSRFRVDELNGQVGTLRLVEMKQFGCKNERIARNRKDTADIGTNMVCFGPEIADLKI